MLKIKYRVINYQQYEMDETWNDLLRGASDPETTPTEGRGPTLDSLILHWKTVVDRLEKPINSCL